MFEKVLMMYIYAETPIHPGSGTVISGVVDLPIQRERHTEFPIIQGSSLKGVLRNAPKGAKKGSSIALNDKCENCPDKEGEEICNICKQIFGSPEGIGGISVTDARVLAFPVRTLKGVFGWITCPLVLGRYKRDLSFIKASPNWDLEQLNIEDKKAIIHSNSSLKVELEGKKYIYIEDLQLEAEERNDLLQSITSEIIEALPANNAYKDIREKLAKDLVIVSDDVFRDLVSLTTEVVTRIKIDPKTGTVQTGGLWSEEYLPTDTIMYSLILIPSRSNNLKPEEITEKLMIYDGKILQIGGDETVGKGFALIKLVEGGGKNVEKS